MNLLHLIQDKFRDALHGLVADTEPYVAMIKPTQDPKHGDYQANCAMSLAKSLGQKPRDLAQKIAFSNSIDMPMPQVGAATAADRCEQSMEPHMVFIVSINWTDQGIRNVKESPKRSDAARKLAKKVGVDIKELYLSTSRSCI